MSAEENRRSCAVMGNTMAMTAVAAPRIVDGTPPDAQ
jgi:hypothetical protein